MATASKRAKAHANLNKTVDEPMLNELSYVVSLTSALNWYSLNTDDKKLRRYALEHFAKLQRKPEVIAINKATDFEVRQLAILCRLVANGNTLSEKHQLFIETTAATLVEKYKKTEVDTTSVVVLVVPTNIQERMDEKAHVLAGEIEGAIDEFVTNKSTDFSVQSYFASKSVSAPLAKRIGDFYTRRVKELEEAIEGSDKQLTEGYSYMSKRELKKFATFMQSIVDDCQQAVQTAKASRAPRKLKVASPTKVVSKMKYMKDFDEMGLKSVKPETILAAAELWVYNTKYRKVQVYKADSGTLSVKGTTVIGFSVKESLSMTLRKPEEFFKGLAMGKRALNAALKKLTTKPTTPNGRINEECILLGAF